MNDSIPSNADAPFHCPSDETMDQRDERMRLERETLAGGPPHSRHAFGKLRIASGYDGVHDPNSYKANFYDTSKWLELRYRALKRDGGHCLCCGNAPVPGNPLQVDHIKPRSKFPELELDLENLQVLCKSCNMGKGAWDQTDWRHRI